MKTLLISAMTIFFLSSCATSQETSNQTFKDRSKELTNVGAFTRL